MKTILLVAAAAADVAVTAAPASAGCYGSANVLVLCASLSPTGGDPLYEDCLYTGGSGCTRVSVPGPALDDCGGSFLGEPINWMC